MSISHVQTSPFSQDAVSCRGVFAADPLKPSAPPEGAVAAEFRDATGRVIAWAWIAPEHAGQRYCDEAWEWLDRHTPESATVRHLKLVDP